MFITEYLCRKVNYSPLSFQEAALAVVEVVVVVEEEEMVEVEEVVAVEEEVVVEEVAVEEEGEVLIYCLSLAFETSFSNY